MRRRKFITLLGGAAVAWPLAAGAQQRERMWRVGTLDLGSQSERVNRTQLDAFREGLAKQGWIEGRSVQFDVRYAEDDLDRMRAHADELVRLAPTLLLRSPGR